MSYETAIFWLPSVLSFSLSSHFLQLFLETRSICCPTLLSMFYVHCQNGYFPKHDVHSISFVLGLVCFRLHEYSSVQTSFTTLHSLHSIFILTPSPDLLSLTTFWRFSGPSGNLHRIQVVYQGGPSLQSDTDNWLMILTQFPSSVGS